MQNYILPDWKEEYELATREMPHLIAVCEVKPKNEAERTIQDYILENYVTHHTNADTDKGRVNIPPCPSDNTYHSIRRVFERRFSFSTRTRKYKIVQTYKRRTNDVQTTLFLQMKKPKSLAYSTP